jgi:hypothetical protein
MALVAICGTDAGHYATNDGIAVGHESDLGPESEIEDEEQQTVE